MGDVDELNSSLGVLLAEPLPDDVRELLVVIQHELFNLGGELSIPGFELLKADAVLRLDEALAHYNAALPRLAEFILPAGTRSAALAHVSRTVARRAERALVALAAHEPVNASAAPVPEPAVGPAVRAGARAQPRQPRRPGRRRRVLAAASGWPARPSDARRLPLGRVSPALRRRACPQPCAAPRPRRSASRARRPSRPSRGRRR